MLSRVALVVLVVSFFSIADAAPRRPASSLASLEASHPGQWFAGPRRGGAPLWVVGTGYRVASRSTGRVNRSDLRIDARLPAEHPVAVAASRRFLDEAGPVIGLESELELRLARVSDLAALLPREAEGSELTLLRYAVAVDDIPVLGAGVSTVVLRERDGGVRVLGAIRGDAGFPDVEANVRVSADRARKVMADETAGGDIRLVRTPDLVWYRGRDDRHVAAWSGLRLALRSEDLARGVRPEEGYTSARVLVDASTAEVLDVVDLYNAADEFLRPVVDGPMENLDESLDWVTMSEVEVSPGPITTICAKNDRVWVQNGNTAGVFLIIAGFLQDGQTVCATPVFETLFGTWPAPDLFATEAETTAGGNTLMDDALDGWTAFYHTDFVADVLESSIGFVPSFPAASPSRQMFVAVNPTLTVSNAFAFPMINGPTADTIVDRVGLTFGTGAGYGATLFGGDPWYVRADFARDRGVIYHEYGHGVLFAQGYLGETDFSTALHEGFGDYLSRVAQGGQDESISEFLLEGNGLPLDLKRTCSSLPSGKGSVVLDADAPTADISDPHFQGQAFCQALAIAEQRIVDGFGGDPTDVLRLAVHSATSWVANDEPSSVIEPIVTFELLRALLAALFGGDGPEARDHALRLGFALRGLMSAESGRTAEILFRQSGGYLVYEAATGINTRFTVELIHDGEPCFVWHDDSFPVKGGTTTRWRLNGRSKTEILSSCPPEEVRARMVSCTDAPDCRMPFVPNPVEMEGSTVRVDLGAL